MKDLRREDLLELLELLLEQDLTWFELRTPTAHIRIGSVPEEVRLAPVETSDGRRPAASAAPTRPAKPAAAPVAPAAAGEGGAAPAPRPTPAAPPPAAGERVVTAPFVGVFYRRPSPNDPPFVEAGARVSAEDTVCLIEVMKLFHSIHAGVDGVVTAIEVGDAELVEYGQVLMRIAPEDPAS